MRGPNEGRLFHLGFSEVRIVLSGDDTAGAFAMSQQPLAPRALAGPLHSHANEEGFIYVLSGRIGAHVDGAVVMADEGATVIVPRGVTHTFWNDTDAPASVLELFTPAGLEGWFRELAEIVAAGTYDLDTIVESGRRHGTELDLDSLQPLLDAYHLQLPGLT
ncbi:MAG: cupin domain-containing protein [Acidimicrobiales bacterium]